MQAFRERQISARLGSACALAAIVAVALASPAAARTKAREPAPKTPAERVSKGPFGDAPKGPAQIIVSINEQKLHLYSDGKEVGETSVATGVPQLPTPTGVFSVIQKQKFHRSNIYSGAPMPFMQRITWSGVAIHEGENIGHPASHGCIRMPHDFAVRLYDFTKMGARVMIAREELKPVAFADSHLFVHKAPPPPPAPAAAPASTSVDPASPAPTAAAPSAAPAPTAAAATTSAPAEGTRTAQNVDNKSTDAAPAKPDLQPAAKADAPTSTSASDAWVQAGAPSAPTPPTQADAPAAPAAAAQASAPAAATTEASAAAPAASTAPADPAAKPVAASDAPAAELRGSVNAPTPVDQPQQAAPSPAAPPAPTTIVETAPATHGPIAIFISRKEKKIYVRQNFTPLFSAPVTITDPDQLVGTTVFTAMDYLDDGTTFRWNVVTFPAERPKVKRVAENERRPTRHGRDEYVRYEEPAKASSAPLPPPQTPAQVLARIDIPADVIERISELMVPGSSLVVSDQGLGEETGEGTDFIVVTRE
jgi:hypothetical protein